MIGGMEVLEQVLQDLPSGIAIDVASGNGGFAAYIAEYSSTTSFVVATDCSPQPLEAIAVESDPSLCAAAMDALGLAFKNGTFASAAISNSLHHVKDPVAVLMEMKRVLLPGGKLLLREMFTGDDQSPSQETHNIMHNWWGAVDRSSGKVHNRVFSRKELTELFLTAGLESIVFEEFEVTGDPFSEEVSKQIEHVYTLYMDKAGDKRELQEMGAKAYSHFKKHGFSGARAMIAAGSKPEV